MALPVTIPNQFANATSSIPLSQLDANFSTLANAVNGIANGSESLSNVSITGGSLDNVSLSNVTITTGNASVSNLTVTNSAVISVNSTSDALRITQTGTGNALVVEDSANPDATPFVIDASGIVGIGTTTPQSTFSITSGIGVLSSSAFLPQIIQRNTTNDTSAPYVIFQKERATAVVQSGDSIGNIQFQGYDGAAFRRAAEIASVVDGTPGTNDMPGRLVFSTTADGASTPTERMRIDSAGRFGFGTSTAAGTSARFGGSITGSTFSVGISSEQSVQSDVTSAARIFQSRPTTQATTWTLGTVSHFYANPQTFGAGSTVTNQHGFIAESSLTGATNNYGFFSNIASGTGRWNFYANGTADNYFAGQVQLGAGTVSAPALSTTGDTNTGIYFPAADNIGFATNGVIRGRWTTDGLCFGSDTAAANALDDYEEGTYTATLTPLTSGSITMNTSNNTLRYTKIGRVVTVTGYLEVLSVSSPTGSHVILNLPFTVANGLSFRFSASLSFNLLGSSKAADIALAEGVDNTTNMRIFDGSINSIGTGSFATYIVASTDFRVSITYFTT